MTIVHEEPDFLIVDKPSGLLTHPNKPGETSLVDELLEQFPELKNIGQDPIRPGIVHRLDKETSGLLVVARTQAMYSHLRKQFDEGKVKKEYTALVYGNVIKDIGEIDLPIGRSKKGPFVAGEGGEREAFTAYEVQKRYKNFTLLHLTPRTGRTHQLRVHLNAIGHSIVGDPLYRAKLKQRIAFPRLFLHASKLSFVDLKGDQRDFFSPTPKELENFLKTI